MVYVIAEPCVDIKDKSCLDVFPVDCIYEGGRSLYIHPDECIDCTACEPVCPVEVIYEETELSDEWQAYSQINAEFFGEVNSLEIPGRADNFKRSLADHPLVSVLPRNEQIP
ncbi:ferredoxin family protein [Lipingzhangella sp. LS1_29]|uniref:Ferredoxin n=1 Tax=Lipingzhangella rawalii TaxID=2055835 RepID=A0ABU2H180_9ACTN|nr:ferredoxin [Lipingzhangella rawalii]MDS1269051.1 ferredoxin family protein [Lipingzhangella rawalii]